MNPLPQIKPGRTIVGMSAILLPFSSDGGIDWPSFRAHLLRTHAAGLTPAVNMDTGYVNLLDAESRRAVLEQTQPRRSVALPIRGRRHSLMTNPEMVLIWMATDVKSL